MIPPVIPSVIKNRCRKKNQLTIRIFLSLLHTGSTLS